MPDFPRQEAKIYQLARVMLYGVFGHMSDFPHVNAMGIFTHYRDYKSARDQAFKARSQAILATGAKQASFQQLKIIMKQCLKRSQVDTRNFPEKLALIGWSAPGNSAPAAIPPGPPRNLTAITDETPGSVKMTWDKPATGGKIRNYLIQRRILNQRAWELVTIAYENRMTLTKQPNGVVLEYQIIAANKAGPSPPGNTATMML